MSTLCQILVGEAASCEPPQKPRVETRRRRQKKDDSLDAILDDPRQIDQMRRCVSSTKGAMQGYEAWHELAWRATAMARDGETLAIKKQGVQILLQMSGVKSDLERSAFNYRNGSEETPEKKTP